MIKLFLIALLCINQNVFAKKPVTYDVFKKRTSLVLVIVLDQFRSDYLIRLENKFEKQNTNGRVGGFDFLIKNSAYIPFAEFPVLQTMTCPGHAMILTGTTPAANGINLNDWYNRKEKRMQYCVEDSEFEFSPRNLKTTTVSDEMALVQRAGKIIGLAVKDRSAIMLAGHHADYAVWYDHSQSQWATSGYYKKGLPSWATQQNEKLKLENGKEWNWKTKDFDKKIILGKKSSLASPYGGKILFDLAKEALKSEKLGQSNKTDFLLLSVSSHDYAGHKFGPLAPEMESMTLSEDQLISDLLTLVKKQLGTLNDVTVVLTADHGIPLLVDDLKKKQIDSGKIDNLELYKKINTKLDKEFGNSGKKSWISASKSLNFYINQDLISEKKLSPEAVESQIKAVMLDEPGVWKVLTKSEFDKGLIGYTEELTSPIQKQYISGQSGDVVIIPRPYYLEKDDNNTNHMTGFSYDRQVPLIIFNHKVNKGVYPDHASILDLASTLSFILGTTSPAGNTGKPLDIF